MYMSLNLITTYLSDNLFLAKITKNQQNEKVKKYAMLTASKTIKALEQNALEVLKAHKTEKLPHDCYVITDVSVSPAETEQAGANLSY